MTTFNNIRNMNDEVLKPQLLRSLIEERVPDNKQPFRNPWELSTIVSDIKAHRLLLESSSVDRKHVKDWKSTVDSWVDCLLVLICSNMPDKRWAGICLLGVTCQECSSDRFLASYSVWFDKLLPHIQSTADSHFVKMASCTSISDLCTRLAGFPSVKKDGVSFAGKLVQSVLNLLNEESSEAGWEKVIDVLCNVLISFPSSVHRHFDSVEAAVVSKIISGNCSDNMLKKLAHCLALLPLSKGDVDSCFLMMQKILLSINVHLNDVFHGLEEETKCKEAFKLVVRPGEDPPPPLGGNLPSGEALDNVMKKSDRLLMSNVSRLMLCCCTVLKSFDHVALVRPLLALVDRVLTVDGSLPQASFHFVTSKQQGFICSQLPVLHSHSLDLLTAIIKGLHSRLLPYAAEVVQIITEYFRKCKLPKLRVEVYSIVSLLTSIGIGLAVALVPDLIQNAFVDLDFIGHDSSGTSSTACLNPPSEPALQPSKKRRKHAATNGSLENQHDKVGSETEVPQNHPTTQTSVKIAALDALTSLFIMGGGSWRSESWRPKVDLLLITVAKNACNGGWANEGRDQHNSPWADFQLASLRALRASLLYPCCVRPPYLSQGLELFHKGKREVGTRLAEFCAQALSDLEVLIHPRARSLGDFNSFGGFNSKLSENFYSGSQKHNPFASEALVQDYDDDLYHSWLENDEVEVPQTEEPSQKFGDSLAGSPGRENLKGLEIGGNVDEIMVESHEEGVAAPAVISEREQFEGGVVAPPVISEREQLINVDSENGTLDSSKNELELPGKDVFSTRSDCFGASGESKGIISNHEKSKGPGLDDDTSSMDSFPALVDAGPDSDIDSD